MNRIAQVVFGLLGLSFVVIVHELGHLIAAKIAGVPVPLFSIGFGIPLVAITLGATTYQVALFPLGGYVAINQQMLDIQSYPIQAFILLAGITANFMFAFCIFSVFRLCHFNIRSMIEQTTTASDNTLVGPIGIIALISHSATLGCSYFFLVLALLSISIGFFNLLPIPFFDGGQLAWYTIEAVTGPLPDTAFNNISSFFIVLFLLFLLYISAKDIRSLHK